MDRLRQLARKGLDALLLARGYCISPYKVIDLRDTFVHPRQFHYYGGHPILVILPASTGRCGLFAVDSDLSPYNRSLLLSRREESDVRLTLSGTLRTYRDTVRTETVRDQYGAPEDSRDDSGNLPLPAPRPWKRYSADEFARYKKRLRSRFDRQLGRTGKEKTLAEAGRFSELVRSIEASGYQRSNDPDGDIGVTALIMEDDSWRWLVESGNHRALALGALSYKEIPVRIEAIVYRRDAEIWPNVLNDTYSPGYARTIFDRIFNAVPGPALKPWLERIDAI